MNGVKYAGGTLQRLPNGSWRISAVQFGKQVQKRFKSKLDAERFLEAVRDGRKPLTPSQVADAQAALAALERAGCRENLLEVVQGWLGSSRTVVRPVSEVVEEYLADVERSIGEYTYRRYSNLLGMFARETPLMLHRIGVEEVKAFIERHTSKDKVESQNGYRNTIGTFLSWAVKHRYLKENPCQLIRPIRVKARDIGCYTGEEVKRIFRTALDEDPAIVPYLILGFFAGIRPIERCRLRFGIHAIDDPSDENGRWHSLNITPDIAKGSKHEQRCIELTPQCRKFLLYWESEFGTISDSIIPLCNAESASRRAKAVILKAIGRYVKDGERHTFATHHFAAYRNSAYTAWYCGHTETVALEHYRKRMLQAVGKAYMSIYPEECGFVNYADTTVAAISPDPRSVEVEGWLGQRWDGTYGKWVEAKVEEWINGIDGD